jgi:hypothetical protein
MCRALDITRELFNNRFEFLVSTHHPSPWVVILLAGCQCDWERLPGCFVYLGCNVEVAVLVFDVKRTPEEGIIIFRENDWPQSF